MAISNFSSWIVQIDLFAFSYLLFPNKSINYGKKSIQTTLLELSFSKKSKISFDELHNPKDIKLGEGILFYFVTIKSIFG